MTDPTGAERLARRVAYHARPPVWARLLLRLLRAVVADRRPPSIVIGGADAYMERWWLLPKNRWCNAYLHRFLRSDDDRAMHDHPWGNVSILLSGAYLEHTPGQPGQLRRAGDVAGRDATAVHRIDLIDGLPVWTLFLTGPKMREWGFLCPGGWRHWRDFANPADDGATVGRGCE